MCLSSCLYADNVKKLLPALAVVESNNNVNAIGDNGKAIGVLQIWKVVVNDVNTVYNTNYTHKNMYNKEKSYKVASLYLKHYGKQYTKQTKKPADLKTLARIWNGGPQGYKKPATLKYWNKVKKEI